MFKEVENHEHYYNVRENGKYGIGIYPVLFGFRVRIWEINSPVCINDLCFGADPFIVNAGFGILLKYLQAGLDPNDIPFQTHKPYPTPCEFTDWIESRAVSMLYGETFVTPTELQEYRDQEFSKAGL